MFKSFEYLNGTLLSSSKIENTLKYEWRYKIIDTNFEETIGTCGSIGEVGAVFGSAIIDLYEKKNLKVALNLVMAFSHYGKKYNRTISELIENNKKYNPKYNRYQNDIEKYLLLM